MNFPAACPGYVTDTDLVERCWANTEQRGRCREPALEGSSVGLCAAHHEELVQASR